MTRVVVDACLGLTCRHQRLQGFVHPDIGTHLAAQLAGLGASCRRMTDLLADKLEVSVGGDNVALAGCVR